MTTPVILYPAAIISDGSIFRHFFVPLPVYVISRPAFTANLSVILNFLFLLFSLI